MLYRKDKIYNPISTSAYWYNYVCCIRQLAIFNIQNIVLNNESKWLT